MCDSLSVSMQLDLDNVIKEIVERKHKGDQEPSKQTPSPYVSFWWSCDDNSIAHKHPQPATLTHLLLPGIHQIIWTEEITNILIIIKLTQERQEEAQVNKWCLYTYLNCCKQQQYMHSTITTLKPSLHWQANISDGHRLTSSNTYQNRILCNGIVPI